jgi:hypothetical protein
LWKSCWLREGKSPGSEKEGDRGAAGCFTFGVMGINKGRFGQLGVDGAVFFVNFGRLSTMKIFLLYLIPGNRIIKLDPGELKKTNVHPRKSSFAQSTPRTQRKPGICRT